MSGGPGRPLRVLFHQRRPHPHQVSIEQVFDGVRAHLPPHVEVETVLDPHPSKGVVPRLQAVAAAWRTRRRADVHHMTGDTTFVALALPRRRTVVTVHDCEILDRLSPLGGVVFRLLWLQLPLLWARTTTVVSPATEAHLRRVLWRAPRDLRVVPNAVADEVLAAEGAPAGARPRRVLAVGTAPNKGIERLASATADLDVVVEVVGDLTDEQRAAFAAHGDRLVELGRLDHAGVIAAYRRAGVLSFASSREGFGLPVLEAHALGVPVVCTDAEPLPWVAGPGGARLVPALAVGAADDGSLRAALLDVLDDGALGHDLVAAGRRNVGRFTQDATAAAYAAIYEELATRR